MTRLSNDDIALAAETALGLLNPAEEAGVAARIATDTAFADEVEAWNERLQAMAAGADQAPPPEVWDALRLRISAKTLQDNGAWFWKSIAAVSTSMAAVFGFMLFGQPEPAPIPFTPLVAALGSKSGTEAMTASYDQASGQLILTPVSVHTGKLFPELWVIPVGGNAVSLGIIRGDHPSRTVLSKAMRQAMMEGATLAITPEPAAGAPGGKATGPVLASGTITTI
jgi:anti-sigma-K factor RskA